MKKLKAVGLTRETKRLVLRPLQLRDDRAWFAAHCTMLPRKSGWDESKLPMDQLNIDNFCDRLNSQRREMDSGECIRLGIFHRETGCLLGHLSLRPSRENQKKCSLDFRIYNTYWGKGFAKEAVAEAGRLAKSFQLSEIEIVSDSKKKINL